MNPDFRDVLGVYGSDNVNAPSYQGALYVYDRGGQSAGVVCVSEGFFHANGGESVQVNGHMYAPVWTASNGPPRSQEGMEHNMRMFHSTRVNCQTLQPTTTCDATDAYDRVITATECSQFAIASGEPDGVQAQIASGSITGATEAACVFNHDGAGAWKSHTFASNGDRIAWCDDSSGNTKCACRPCMGGYVFTVNTCVVYHCGSDTEEEQVNCASQEMEMLRTIGPVPGASTFETTGPTCPEPPVAACANGLVGDDTCNFVGAGGPSNNYYYTYLRYDDSQVTNPTGEFGPFDGPAGVFPDANLFQDGYCDANPSTSRWRIISASGDGTTTQGFFTCQSYDPGDGTTCYTTDYTDCCNSPDYATHPCSGGSSASLQYPTLTIPMPASMWLSLMRNQSTESLEVPGKVMDQLMHIAMEIVEPVSASASESSLMSTANGKVCLQTSLANRATSCRSITTSSTCTTSYQAIVGVRVVAACHWSGTTCGRGDRPYRACPLY